VFEEPYATDVPETSFSRKQLWSRGLTVIV
jgi:hypothetical protein